MLRVSATRKGDFSRVYTRDIAEFNLKILFYTRSTSKQLNITVQKRIVVMKEDQPYKDNDKV